ncbi:Lrp/AsnC family transcriptional regulator [Oscillatoria sp. CS-180]|uniref:Lrp/AsnC family transcriptional regulator n=1 Tax=Oscillatoria sp. CS-180 TaxID=3021720 RepID=UPI0023309505|nr:Lrp/AsnC family transcriptional regulator [Oscillatoria sp. CS-180]MDB9525067.1 Lrp/AsnC family transcriptional regulator [Oscillatoria sp. CS-180]
MSLDALDSKVVKHLMQQARMTWAELAAQLGLSAPAAADRVRKLEERGVIQGYWTRVNPQSLGYDLTAFVAVTLEHPRDRDGFLTQIHALPEIQECHHVTGDDDYLLKVRCRGTQGLEHLITNGLKQVSGVLKTRTIIVLSTVKETIALPIQDSDR